MTETTPLIATLRSCLSAPSVDHWRRICDVIEGCSDVSEQALLVEYVAPHLASWMPWLRMWDLARGLTSPCWSLAGGIVVSPETEKQLPLAWQMPGVRALTLEGFDHSFSLDEWEIPARIESLGFVRCSSFIKTKDLCRSRRFSRLSIEESQRVDIEGLGALFETPEDWLQLQHLHDILDAFVSFGEDVSCPGMCLNFPGLRVVSRDLEARYRFVLFEEDGETSDMRVIDVCEYYVSLQLPGWRDVSLATISRYLALLQPQAKATIEYHASQYCMELYMPFTWFAGSLWHEQDDAEIGAAVNQPRRIDKLRNDHLFDYHFADLPFLSKRHIAAFRSAFWVGRYGRRPAQFHRSLAKARPEALIAYFERLLIDPDTGERLRTRDVSDVLDWLAHTQWPEETWVPYYVSICFFGLSDHRDGLLLRLLAGEGGERWRELLAQEARRCILEGGAIERYWAAACMTQLLPDEARRELAIHCLQHNAVDSRYSFERTWQENQLVYARPLLMIALEILSPHLDCAEVMDAVYESFVTDDDWQTCARALLSEPLLRQRLGECIASEGSERWERLLSQDAWRNASDGLT